MLHTLVYTDTCPRAHQVSFYSNAQGLDLLKEAERVACTVGFVDPRPYAPKYLTALDGQAVIPNRPLDLGCIW